MNNNRWKNVFIYFFDLLEDLSIIQKVSIREQFHSNNSIHLSISLGYEKANMVGPTYIAQ